MAAIQEQGLLDSLGKEAGCQRLAREFYARVAANAELKPLFPGKSLRCATEEFAAFLIQFLDGDPTKTQYRWWLSLQESHARFRISEVQRATWLGLMRDAIDSVIDDSVTRQALGQFFEIASRSIVGKSEGFVEHEELRDRWAEQQRLEQLIAAIGNGHDLEAVSLSRQFVSRTSVFVGILAGMMEAGREPLVDFVLESIVDQDQVVAGRFNGRSLLHFAAGSGFVPIVRQLLLFGADPNTLDAGGHAPLYRVPRMVELEGCAEIVALLVQAGAAVDHAGGVNRSTALHQAARFDSLEVAKALLKAGASPWVRDKKGFTPLDRAVNCRRHELVALLTAVRSSP